MQKKKLALLVQMEHHAVMDFMPKYRKYNFFNKGIEFLPQIQFL